jgi:hypothetical protein
MYLLGLIINSSIINLLFAFFSIVIFYTYLKSIFAEAFSASTSNPARSVDGVAGQQKTKSSKTTMMWALRF